MTRKTRTFLFILCVFLFALAAPSVVFYSQGYRLDLNPPAGGKMITRTGAFYFKVLPKGAGVYLNGELKKETSLFLNSALIENLLPKTYEIEIKKEGYHSWTKKLAIAEKQVTEAKNIVLFPENPDFTVLNEAPPAIVASATSTNNKKVVMYNAYEIGVLFLQTQYEQPQRTAGENVFLTRFSEKIGDIFWLNDDYLVFNVGDEIKIAEIDNRDRLNLITLAEFKSPKIVWDKKEKKLYVLSEGKLYLSNSLLP